MMKMNWIVVGAAALAAGCIESRTVVTVKNDGSGRIVVEEYMSPQLTAMMDQFKDTIAPGATNKPATAADPLAMFADQIEKKNREFGGKARLEKREPAANAAGWKGFRLTYAFDDVRQVLLPLGTSAEGDEEKPSDRMKVEFTPGRKAVLRLVPAADVDQPSGVSAAPASPPPEANPQMAAMMAPMFAGMRVSLAIAVDGRITRNDGGYVASDGKSVTLLDVPVDKLLGHAEAMKLMMDKSIGDAEKARLLAGLKIDGLQVTDVTRPVTIEFE